MSHKTLAINKEKERKKRPNELNEDNNKNDNNEIEIRGGDDSDLFVNMYRNN
jgi:hypothetical protein